MSQSVKEKTNFNFKTLTAFYSLWGKKPSNFNKLVDQILKDKRKSSDLEQKMQIGFFQLLKEIKPLPKDYLALDKNRSQFWW